MQAVKPGDWVDLTVDGKKVEIKMKKSLVIYGFALDKNGDTVFVIPCIKQREDAEILDLEYASLQQLEKEGYIELANRGKTQ